VVEVIVVVVQSFLEFVVQCFCCCFESIVVDVVESIGVIVVFVVE
jgi:hypothetical protein